MELALEKLLDACCNTEARKMPGAESGEEEDREEDTEWLVRSPGVTNIVRKELAPAIRDLVHHGLGQGSSSLSVNPFSGCMSARGGAGARAGILHAWDVVMKFYEMKGGAEYNSAPARRLSRSFGLDLAGSGTGNKQVRTGNTIVYQKMIKSNLSKALLQTIGQILSSQQRKSPDAHFKTLICSGLKYRKIKSEIHNY